MMLDLVRKYFRCSINAFLWINLILLTFGGFITGIVFGVGVAGDFWVARVVGGLLGGMVGQMVGGICGLLINLLLGGFIVTILEIGNDISIIKAKTADVMGN